MAGEHCPILVACVAGTLRNAVKLKALFKLLWFALEDGIK